MTVKKNVVVLFIVAQYMHTVLLYVFKHIRSSCVLLPDVNVNVDTIHANKYTYTNPNDACQRWFTANCAIKLLKMVNYDIQMTQNILRESRKGDSRIVWVFKT